MILPQGLQIYHHLQAVRLERGATLPAVQIAYHTFGTLNNTKDNVVWVFHALTANSDPTEWWKGVIGEHTWINPKEHFIVCANVLGSFYGSTNPRTENPQTQHPYGRQFPMFTVRDVVHMHHLLREYLEIEQIKIAIGGSFGGHQALEFALAARERVQSLVLLATSARETAWSIAIHEAQRMAIETDPTWQDNSPKAGAKGLQTARGIGLLSYRTIQSYIDQQTDEEEKLEAYKAASYIRYQGEKLEKRFHAQCYWYLTKCLDSHHVGRGRGSIEAALQQLTIPCTVIGIDTDMLIPPTEQQFLAQHLPKGQYYEIPSRFGHDGFLIEVEAINVVLKEHFERLSIYYN
ncbi:MAG: homoserine O-acetyltransferase family protein [Aureispira sp.]